ncbi:MAG: DegT/DnrJ/EryC1/StrS family aminotransferase [SAR324 cluster bacterium]|nr:DegT/DnrJ/EryC1/StrS family aminotransferase [SAR324 cluster bacterium]
MENQKIDSVPLLDLKAQLSDLRDEIVQAVTEVVDSTQYIMGPKVLSLEKAIADYSGVTHAIGVSSGTDALLLSLMALDVQPGDCVITTDFSFFATAGVIARLNARPVFVDIDPVTFNLDPEQLEKVLNTMSSEEKKRVKAIIVVHLYGQCADMSSIVSIAERYQIPVIEDAAQAIGAEYMMGAEKKRTGNLGTMGCFSFFPSKNLGGIGDAGMVVTNDAQLADQLRLKRVHGAKSEYCHEVIGGNFRIDPIQAAVLEVKLPHLDSWHHGRQQNAELYTALFEQKGLSQIIPPQPVYQDQGLSNYHIYNQYMIRAPRRDELQKFLTQNQVAARVYYPIAFHRLECFQSLGYAADAFPESEKASNEVLALPIYPELTDAMQEYVVEKIAEFYQ